eukprot:TRINITY_DN118249_c1_g1_i1.p1 TRINITY_DN118249_c1_g1~~TRINITY_DN118249_c1_g1_i1.p1  ORF type:complete len:879 (-),score=67.93 TRINITY_DN118249_c1_g1_i1:134-2770(-)
MEDDYVEELKDREIILQDVHLQRHQQQAAAIEQQRELPHSINKFSIVPKFWRRFSQIVVPPLFVLTMILDYWIAIRVAIHDTRSGLVMGLCMLIWIMSSLYFCAILVAPSLAQSDWRKSRMGCLGVPAVWKDRCLIALFTVPVLGVMDLLLLVIPYWLTSSQKCVTTSLNKFQYSANQEDPLFPVVVIPPQNLWPREKRSSKMAMANMNHEINNTSTTLETVVEQRAQHNCPSEKTNDLAAAQQTDVQHSPYAQKKRSHFKSIRGLAHALKTRLGIPNPIFRWECYAFLRMCIHAWMVCPVMIAIAIYFFILKSLQIDAGTLSLFPVNDIFAEEKRNAHIYLIGITTLSIITFLFNLMFLLCLTTFIRRRGFIFGFHNQFRTCKAAMSLANGRLPEDVLFYLKLASPKYGDDVIIIDDGLKKGQRPISPFFPFDQTLPEGTLPSEIEQPHLADPSQGDETKTKTREYVLVQAPHVPSLIPTSTKYTCSPQREALIDYVGGYRAMEIASAIAVVTRERICSDGYNPGLEFETPDPIEMKNNKPTTVGQAQKEDPSTPFWASAHPNESTSLPPSPYTGFVRSFPNGGRPDQPLARSPRRGSLQIGWLSSELTRAKSPKRNKVHKQLTIQECARLRVSINLPCLHLTVAGWRELTETIISNQSITSVTFKPSDTSFLGPTTEEDRWIGLLGIAAMEQTILRCPNIDRINSLRFRPMLDPSISVFRFEGSLMGDWTSIGLLAQLLADNTTLQCLHLRANWIGNFGALLLSRALAKHPSLKVVDLSGNIIADRGAIAIGNALKRNKSITHLSLSANKIRFLGAKALADGLEKHPSLTYLNLGENHIGPRGMGALQKALKASNNESSPTQRQITLVVEWGGSHK